MIDRILTLLSRWLYGDFSIGRNAAMRQMLARVEPERPAAVTECVEVD